MKKLKLELDTLAGSRSRRLIILRSRWARCADCRATSAAARRVTASGSARPRTPATIHAPRGTSRAA